MAGLVQATPTGQNLATQLRYIKGPNGQLLIQIR